VIGLPEKSLIKNQWVYVVENDRIQQRMVQIMGSEKGMVLVKGDLAAGERIVISDPRVLQPDMQVNVLP
jgi:hypothetical protein